MTGRPPFQTRSPFHTYQSQISHDADLLNFVRPEVSAELAAVVAKMMAKDPDRRFQTPKDVSQALKPMFRTGGVSFAISSTEVSRIDGPVIASETVGGVSTPTQPTTHNLLSPGTSSAKTEAAADATYEPLIDQPASEHSDWSRRPARIVTRIEPGARVILAIFGAILLRLLVVISSVLTFGSQGATIDESRLSSMGVVFTVAGIVLASLLGGRQIRRPDQFAVGFTGGLFGVLFAAVLHAVIRSVEPVFGPLSSSVSAILMLWSVLGAVIGLILAVVVPHRQDGPEAAR